MKRRAFTLVELLVVIAIIALLLAILGPSLQLTKKMDKRLQCASRARNLAYSVTLYSYDYDEKMPLPNGGTGSETNKFVKTGWHLSTLNGATGSQTWYGMGCLFKAGLIADGRLFYCPATPGWQDEFKSYSNPGPWGTKLDQQLPNKSSGPGFSSSTLRCMRGYSYWPLGRTNYSQAECDAIGSNDGFNLRYAADYPRSPLKFADLAPAKSLAFDLSLHKTNDQGYGINVAFGDSHVDLAKVPQETDGLRRYRYPYQQDGGVPDEDRIGGVSAGAPDAAKWVEEKMWLYTAALGGDD